MTAPRKVLVVDDEPQIRRLLKSALARASYAVVEADTARAALAAVDIDHPDVILLDLGLPDRDGLELIPLIRAKSAAPLIVISARTATDEKVSALDLGASDYLTKPFDTDELLARVRSALRHTSGDTRGAPLVVGEVQIDLVARLVHRAGAEVHLTAREYAVLAELAAFPGRIVTHAQLLTAAWGGAYRDNVEYLRVVVRNLRLKLEADPAAPRLIVNDLGIGYRLMTL
jgi:two-component system KDP operon response regulator KdpE